MGVATSIAVGSAIIGAGLSFNQAANARRAQRKADADAARYLADARKKAEKDYFAGLNVPLDSFEAELENNLQTTTTAIEALQEGDARALAAGVGKVGAQAQQNAEDVRIDMGEQMFALDKMKAENRDDINQQLIAMDAAAAQDAAKRAADADAQVAAANTAGINSLTSGLMTGLQASPLYGKSKADRELMSALDKKGITMAEYVANPDKFPNILGRQQAPVVPKLKDGVNTVIPFVTPTQGAANDPLLGTIGIRNPQDINRSALRSRGGEGPMNMVVPRGFGGLTMPSMNSFSSLQNNQTPGFTGYMGRELSRLYDPLDFNQRLNKFGVNANYDYLSFLKK
tara:strand:- start:2457 stop:3482 length:1026 start_codon:yes stop_codon:yes gene_type:complete